MKIVALLLKRFPLAFSIAAVIGLLSGFCNAALVAVISIGLREPEKQGLVPVFVLVAIVSVASAVLAHAQMLKLANNLLAKLRIELARAVLAAPYSKIEQTGGPRLILALTEDIQTVGNAANALVGAGIAGATIVGALVYVAWLSPLLCVIVVVPIAISVFAEKYFLRQGYMTVGKAMAVRGAMARAIASSVAGISELKLHRKRRAAFFTEGFRPSTRAFHSILDLAMRLFGVGESFMVGMAFVAVGAALFLYPRISPTGIAGISGAVLAILYLPASISAVVGNIQVVTSADATVTALEKLGVSLAEGAREASVVTDAPLVWTKLELAGVTHTYKSDDDREFTLGPVELTLKPGEIVFIAGGNGSGKTTLAKILVGLYVPEKGELRLDGRVIGPDELASYRAHFSVIFSDFFLFDKIYGGRGKEEDAKANALVHAMELDEKVQVKDGAFSTIELSQGQRKRLALVVAQLQDRPIYVLDEWAAQQDPYFKDIFYTRLLPELRAAGKTVVVVTHDDRYFPLADRVIRLDEGKVRVTEAEVPAPIHAPAPVALEG